MNPSEIQAIKNRFGIIGTSPVLNHAINVAIQVAATDLTVLITGESGSGKESFSKIIHNLSSRKHGPFIAINCGAIPEGTIDSELFGHEKGAFTGALDARKGYFETTNGGTIFLDEVGEMPMGTQARLLRVLENGEYIRVGSSKVMKTNVRIVAATNVNLLDAVNNSKFREDLFYRLNTVPIYVPPLRDRGEDVLLLFRKFTNDFSEKYRSKPVRLDTDARELLMQYPFPGNIRQLKNIAEQITILETDKELPITAHSLNNYLNPVQPAGRKALVPLRADDESANPFSERELLYKVLFDMRRDVTELKKLVRDVLENEKYGGEILKDHQELFSSIGNIEPVIPAPTMEPTRLLTPPPPRTVELDRYDRYSDDRDDIEDVVHVSAEEESLSLEDKEKEMIIKALRKNNNKRKYAASALGISERTLYRKIKQYDIEE
ncbi:Anaerobic nitric oxide reductase transcription regulator NorR [Dyadobacter sp. CECT 9275]|uniref:Anaerobic nitric oxide reductase transcription regulator NorR n=1 Tax=Dyadobacter helix TaxID=2822344 RepID=A0A916JE40_9BACT|nr:sigma-54 dependent transcriptional regulator [Dyadobacter sp. CECT 9275]CAG5002956.1 Anaerobic nitric oxide reductase transcription regulator NorR [Dyadobacter sp. CECT 9275]